MSTQAAEHEKTKRSRQPRKAETYRGARRNAVRRNGGLSRKPATTYPTVVAAPIHYSQTREATRRRRQAERRASTALEAASLECRAGFDALLAGAA